MGSTRIILVLCTCPDRETAEQIAGLLVSEKLAACVTLTPPVTSVFDWGGRREHAAEVLLLAKTAKGRYEEIERRILELHPYELHEIIALPVEQGLAGYVTWVEQCTQGA